jgi:tripartite-type tricarboxylate transporter receptor subunit TctC
MSLKLATLAGFVFALATFAAHGQAWPTKPIKAIVPFSAGAATDTLARPVLTQMSKILGQPIIVENKPGAGGTIGMATVAHAEPDGYTILVHSNSFTVVPSTYTKLNFDPVKDLTGVMPIASLPMALVVDPSRYKTVADLVKAGKEKPGSINYASAGAGGVTHLGAERFRMAAGFEAQHVPYKGSAEALTDVMTDRVDYYFSTIGLALPLIKAGKLGAIAVSSAKRSNALPDVPTTVEAGVPNSTYEVWVGMMVNSKTPRPIVDKLHDALVQAIETPEVKEAFKNLVAEPMMMSVDQFNTMMKNEVSVNAGLVKAAHVEVN